MAGMTEYLKTARERGASDLYIVAGRPVSAKIGGQIVSLDSDRLLPPRTEELIGELYKLAGHPTDGYAQGFRDEFSFAAPGLARFRVCAYRQRGSMAAVVRIVAFEIPDWQALHIPETVMSLAEFRRGLVLFTGGSGSGKSTTCTCLIDRINHTRPCHIVTLEDPIEFLYRDDRSVISQQEVGSDVEDMRAGLRFCLRQSPDVILLGELAGLELLRGAVAAAESGHLVLAALNGKGALPTVSRLLELYPAEQREQARAQLSHVLRAVVSQQLLPAKDGGLVPAFELLTVNRFISAMLRDGQADEIAAAVAAGQGDGLISADQAIMGLYRAGLVTLDAALSGADNPEQLRRRCG